MAFGIGPRARRVYDALRHQIIDGNLAAGTKLPGHLAIAEEFGVAPLTARHVLARLEAEGLVQREPGRGTFVRRPTVPAVLIAEDDDATRRILRLHAAAAGYRVIEAADATEAHAALAANPDVALVLSDVRMPRREDGIGFIRSVRRQRPDLPIAAVTGHPEDLSGLHGTPECPILILSKPVWAHQIREALRLTLAGERNGVAAALPNGVFDGSSDDLVLDGLDDR